MSHESLPLNALSTPEQASEIFLRVSSLSGRLGVRSGYALKLNTISFKTPYAVRDHFSTPLKYNEDLNVSLTISQYLEKDGKPKTKGMVGNLEFAQSNKTDSNLIVGTRVYYQFINDDSALRIERTVVDTSFLAPSSDFSRNQMYGSTDLLGHAVKREEEVVPDVVSFDEAQQIIDFLSLIEHPKDSVS